MRTERSKRLYERATQVIPGGVSSPVRAFKGVGGSPLFVSRAEGPHIYDADGQRYIDYVGSWGPLIAGHAHPAILEAIERAAKDGTSFGFATAREVELAERVIACVPSVERVRFVNSGTEATMSAIRLARAATDRDKILKFAGCYHGHADAFLSEGTGSGVATLGIPGTAGVPASTAQDTITVPFNDLQAVSEAFSTWGSELAAVILEPVPCNTGLMHPDEGFLQRLRELCDQHGSLLVFDEVITGFRLGLGGAQQYFDVRPDLTTFGKVIGGGLPVGAYGGRKDLMDRIAPSGDVYQAGTLSGNPLAMAAGLATLELLSEPDAYATLDARGQQLQSGVQEALAQHGHPAKCVRMGSIFYLWFKPNTDAAPRNHLEVQQGDSAVFGRFFHALLQEGVAIAPSAYEVGFISLAHSQTHIEATTTAMGRALAKAVEVNS